MFTHIKFIANRAVIAWLLIANQAVAELCHTPAESESCPQVQLNALAAKIQIGDIVFIHVSPLPFEKVSQATQSWVNHVGIVVAIADGMPVVAESKFPFSKKTSLDQFIARSSQQRVAVSRLRQLEEQGLNKTQQGKLNQAVNARMGIFYDAGFNLHSQRQFCSRFVREVLYASTGITLGEVTTFTELFGKNPNTDLTFWQFWFFGQIPWDRQTVTPASEYQDLKTVRIFDGIVI